MIRFVVGPNSQIVPDLFERLPGRGIWLVAERTRVEMAVTKNLFAKAAKQKVNVDKELSSQLEVMLARSCLNLLGLAQRSGEIRTGFEKVRGFLKSGDAAILLAATDAAEDGRTKLRKLAAGVSEETKLMEMFSSNELSLALGHQNVVHAAVRFGGLAERLKREALRLGGFREKS